MLQNYKEISMSLPDGTQLTLETGKLAKQADGSVVLKVGNMMLLATVVANQKANENVDFLPLSVDYQEKFAAIGKIPGGFFRREGKLSDYEVLISRLVDRAIRPLFPDDFHAETQVLISLISADVNIMPDAYVALAVSTALTISDIPFQGPISEVRVIKTQDGQFIVNPITDLINVAILDLIVAGTEYNILMVEGESKEVQEDEMIEALKIAHQEIKKQCKLQLDLKSQLQNIKPVREYNHEEKDEELNKLIQKSCYDKCYQIAGEKIADKHIRSEKIAEVKQQFKDSLPEDHKYSDFLIDIYFKATQKKAVRNCMLDTKIRLDGRKSDEIRDIWGEINYLPSAHGSAIFTRGETQSLTSVTLGSKLDEQIIDGAMISGYNKFLLHYNFPAFSTGEVKPSRGPGRREVGHGNLALRALKPVIPENFPYTIRIVSDILESNGSSSMATVCAGTMALMDAGVKIKKPVSGIAMGMIACSDTKRHMILSDILGDEDHLGDMDFKVTGTEDGITACQMDIKIDGLSFEVLKEALLQAKKGRLHILNKMKEVIAEPKPDLKSNAPRIEVLKIPKEFIGAVIGPGGKVIQEIQRETGATLVIEEIENEGVVNIFSKNKESLDAAYNWIKKIVEVPEIGKTYEGKVKSIMPFGAFVEFLPGKDGLLHISEIKWERVEKMDGLLQEGEKIQIKLVDIDKKTGKFRLSRKELLPKPE